MSNLPEKSDQKVCRLFSISSVEAITSQDDNNYRLLVEGSLICLAEKDQRDRTTSVDVIKARIKEYKKLEKDNQIYEGTVFYNNIHGNGFYLINEEGARIFYDGLYYLNKLEGYGQVFNEKKGEHYQGLFKKNQRYGPGILTHSNLTQDVGIWEGFFLVRLLTAGSSDIPTLANTSSGRAKLLKYKYLIPMDAKKPNYAKELLRELNIPDPDRLKAKTLFNSQVTHEDSLFFIKKLYDENFLENFFQSTERSSIDVLCAEHGGKEGEILNEEDEADVCSNSSKRHQSCQTNLRYLEIRRKVAELVPIYERYAEQKENLLGRIEYCKHCCQSVEPEEQKDEADDYEENVKIIVDDIRASYLSQFSYASGYKSDASSTGTGRYNTTPTFSDYYVPSAQSNIPSAQSNLPSAQSNQPNEQTSIKVSYATQNDELKRAIKEEEEICPCPEELHSNEVDLELLEDELREVEKHEWFYKAIIDSLTEKQIQDGERDDNRSKYFNKTKKVFISELVSWNNEGRMMDIQKHCFNHRYSENMITFNVPEFLKGNRKQFQHSGRHEETCTEFLTACGQGDKDLIREILTSDKVNVNVTDGKGNSAIFFATVKNRLDVIPILTNHGAKLDQVNDEGLTPLALCILKYLAVKNKVTDWEKAFLSELDTDNSTKSVTKWYDIKSFLSLMAQSSETCANNQNDSLLENVSNPRLIELITKLPNAKMLTSVLLNTKENVYLFDLNYKNSNLAEKDKNFIKESSQNSLDKVSNDNLKQINLTIMTLLEYGADPNIGDVPNPVLVLAIFTENPNLVKRLLKSKADINVIISKDNLTCLHVVATLAPSEKNLEICEALLANRCDPNRKTNPEHWADQNSYIKGKIPEDYEMENLGKNPLHMLCMRNDFDNNTVSYFGQLAKLLIENGVDLQDRYLGQTALSLAVLVGNVELVRYLIKENLMDPYEVLPYEMGNALTLYTLKRFENLLPIAKCKEMLEMFFEVNVNFLNEIGSYENAIHFAERTENFINLKQENKEPIKSKKGKNKEKKTKSKLEKSVFLNTLKEFVKDLARKTIIRYIQLKSVQILYDFSEEKLIEHDKAVYLAEFLTPHLAIANLNVLLKHGNIESDRFDVEVAKNMVEFVNIHQKGIKEKKGKKGKEIKVKKEPKSKKVAKNNKKQDESAKNEPVESKSKEPTIDDLLENLTRTEPSKREKYVTDFGLDDPQKYIVCFNCLKSTDKELKLCPKCQMVYFCSTQCNKQAIKKKTLHICNLVFYENMAENDIENCLEDLANIAKQSCLKRLFDKREDLRRQNQEKLLQLWKADTYGTKFMKYKYILENCPSNSHKMHIEDMERLSNVRLTNQDSFFLETHNRLSSLSKFTKNESNNYNTTKTAISDISVKDKNTKKKSIKQRVKINSCNCLEKNASLENKPQEEFKKIHFKDYTQNPLKFEIINRGFAIHDRRPIIVKQLKKVPEKYHRFMEILSKYFPDIDLSSWFLPYACCSEGQLYYKFCDDLFRDSYSFL